MKKRITVVVMRIDLGLWWIATEGHKHHDEKPFVSEEQVEIELAVLGWKRSSKTFDSMLSDAKRFILRGFENESETLP